MTERGGAAFAGARPEMRPGVRPETLTSERAERVRRVDRSPDAINTPRWVSLARRPCSRYRLVVLVYRENPKHKPGRFGAGPPRWFPSYDTACPADLSDPQSLLADSVEAADAAHPSGKARHAIDEQGRFFKAYPEETDGSDEYWHGYPVREELVPKQVPARVLREFVSRGKLTRARYKKLLGSAR